MTSLASNLEIRSLAAGVESPILRPISEAEFLEFFLTSFKDTVRIMYIIPQAGEFSKCWPILKKYLGEVRPAATMISAGLSDPRMKIEIQVTARKQKAADANIN